jgi:nicotinate-nucleotide adenylyltransferase
MRVALFGGSFNPPHVAHQLVALYVVETRPVDEVWMLPCFKHPFEKDLESFEDRRIMCEIAAAPLGSRIKVSDVEQRLGGQSRTLRTVKAVQAENPGVEFSLVIGSDLEAETASWYGAAELRSLVSFLIIGRSGFPGGGAVSMPAISSREIRQRLARGLPVDELVPRAVLDYIVQRGLYGARETP